MTEQEIINLIVPFAVLLILLCGGIGFYKIRTKYKIEELRQGKAQAKKESSIEGSLTKMIKNAPDQLKQIDSEIATLQEKGRREKIPEDQMKNLLSRLNSERDMLSYATKYGDVAIPFLKPLDKILNGWIGKFGGMS